MFFTKFRIFRGDILNECLVNRETRAKVELVKDLEIPHKLLYETIVHPEFTFPGLTWMGTQHHHEQVVNHVAYG